MKSRGENMPKDKPAHLQTPILQSVKDQLYELKDRRGHGNTGETIGDLLDCKLPISDEAVKVIDDWMNAHGFETRYLALQDLLLEFRDMYLGEKAKKYGEG